MKSASRTFDLFDAFAKMQTPLSLSDLARHMKMPISTCFNLVRTFEARGFLYSLGSRRGLYPTKRMLQLVSTIAQHDPIGLRVSSALSELRDKTDETVVLSKRNGDKVIYMEVLESSHRIRYSAAVSEIRDSHANSMGKALLGQLLDAERKAIISKLKFTKYTSRTLQSATAYAADIAKSAKRGYCLNDGESLSDVVAIAVALAINDDHFAVALVGPRYRMKAAIATRAERLQRACQAIADGG
ncbi:MAG: IclR family transcriptional regulator [Bradyrhizobium sp.]